MKTKSYKRIFVIVDIILFLTLILLLTFGILSAIRMVNRLNNYHESEATLVTFSTISDGDSTTYRAFFSFYANNIEYTVIIDMPTRPKYNHPYPILYNPENPIDVVLKRSLYINPIVLNVVALFMMPMLVFSHKITKNFYNPDHPLKESGKKKIAKVIEMRKETKIRAGKRENPWYLVCEMYHEKKQTEIKSNIFFEDISVPAKEPVVDVYVDRQHPNKMFIDVLSMREADDYDRNALSIQDDIFDNFY